MRAMPEVDTLARAGAWFWGRRNINALDDSGDFVMLPGATMAASMASMTGTNDEIAPAGRWAPPMTAVRTAIRETMDGNDMNVPEGTGGALGFLVAAVSGAVWFIRKAMRKDKVGGAETQAQIDIIARLSEQVAKANERADLAEQRADTAYKERNEHTASGRGFREQAPRIERL